MAEGDSTHQGKNEIIIVKRRGGLDEDGGHGGVWKRVEAMAIRSLIARAEGERARACRQGRKRASACALSLPRLYHLALAASPLLSCSRCLASTILLVLT